MRSLAAILSTIILGAFLFISLVMITWISPTYEENVYQYVLGNSKQLVPFIEQELLENPDNHKKVIDKWSAVFSIDDSYIKMIDRLEVEAVLKQNKSNHFIKSLKSELQTEQAIVIATFKHPSLKFYALEIGYQYSFSDQLVSQIYASMYTIFAFMLFIILLISWIIYRYINNIRRVTTAVAKGQFDQPTSRSLVPTVQLLFNDIDNMAKTIEEQRTENITLTGAIHHELRIPITRIRLALDMAVENDNNPLTQELLVGMDGDLEELSVLMEELLTISRLRLSGQEIEKSQVSVNTVVTKVNQSLNNHKIHLNLAPEFQLFVSPTLLERAIYNIISNACKYSQNTVTVTTELTANHFSLTVDDDGPGIPINERNAVLKPFYRIDKSRNRHTGGIGLGLSIANMVIKDSNGHLTIEDSQLGGAKFIVSWPI